MNVDIKVGEDLAKVVKFAAGGELESLLTNARNGIKEVGDNPFVTNFCDKFNKFQQKYNDGGVFDSFVAAEKGMIEYTNLAEAYQRLESNMDTSIADVNEAAEAAGKAGAGIQEMADETSSV